MTHEEEMKLVRELGDLRSRFSLTDQSEENLKRGERIKEIMNELGLHSEPRKDRRPSVIRWK